MSDEGYRLLHNAVCLACITLLAIAFGKWWLIFLTALFWSCTDKEDKEDKKDKKDKEDDNHGE